MDNINAKAVNKMIYFSLLIFSISIIFFVSKYVGVMELLRKILISLVPVFVAIFVSFILEPFIGFFLRNGIRRRYGVLLVYGLIILFLASLLYFIIPSLGEQISVFISSVPDLLDIVASFFDKAGLSINIDEFGRYVKDILINISSKIMSYISSSFSTLFNVILGVSGAIFLSFDFPKFRSSIKKYIPSRIKKPVIYYFQNFLPFVHKYFVGMLIDSLIIFVISIIGFYLIGIDYTLVVALLIAITNLIPIIGPYIGGVPAAIIGFSVSSTLGISAIIVVVIVQIIESNFVQPLILKNVIKLHPLEGILGISLFGALLGVIGMILSPILVVAIKLLFMPYNQSEDNSLIETKNDS